MIKNQKQKILLAVTPFWDPLVPAQGIAALKRFLQKHGYHVRTLDMNIETQFMELYNRYFDIFRKYIPEEKWGNLYSIGHFVLQNQMTAHFNYDDEEKYIELVKILVYQTFFENFDDACIKEMTDLMDEIYRRFDAFLAYWLDEEEPDIFGATVNTGTFPGSLYAFKQAKKLRPGITTIMGGNIFADQMAEGSPNYSFLLEKTRDYLDKIMKGPGELLMLRYLEGKLSKSQRVYTQADLNGEKLTFADLEPPDLSDYNVSAYPYLAAQGSGSCKYQCSFCNSVSYWGEFRPKDVKQTASEMKQLHKQYGGQLFFMTDAMLNPIIDELADELGSCDMPIYYDSFFKVDEESTSIENTIRWRQGGFYRARLGVETGSQHILDLIDKQITIEQTKAAIRALAYAGIKTTTYWVVGHPDETEEDFLKTLALLEELKDDIWQAEVAQFDYYYAGQAKSDEWADRRMLLYPEWAKDMVISQSWILKAPPTREETYKRMFRFVERCKQLGIPNPYSLMEIRQADERWQNLQKNAVPAMMDMKKKAPYVDDRKDAGIYFTVQSDLLKDQGNFAF
ncbi:MAG: radical SAM protein [bacterium]|nr:radical SAM protein [bacterium]